MIYLREKCIAELAFWKRNDIGIYRKIQKLIESIEINPFKGIGKPEPLKYELSGLWSRRIDRKNRLIYSAKDGDVWIMSCKGHYDRDLLE